MGMDPQIKSEWLADLRDPFAYQGRGQLMEMKSGDDIAYCCLGVLLDGLAKRHPSILEAAGVKFPVRVHGESTDYFGTWAAQYDHGGTTNLLPESVAERIGLDIWFVEFGSGSPRVETPGGTQTLAKLNDGGMSFAVIADLIEEQL